MKMVERIGRRTAHKLVFIVFALLSLSYIEAEETRTKTTTTNTDDEPAAAFAGPPPQVVTKIAFGSCHNSKKVDPSKGIIWDAIRKENADVFLWAGDSVYPRKRQIATVPEVQALYDDMLTNQTIGYAGFAPPLGIYGTWDDHDYGGNDMGREMPDKAERSKAFFDFLGLPKSPTPPEREGLYYSVEFGTAPRKVKVIFLDTRWNRGNHCIPSVATKMPLGAGFSALTRWLTAGFDLYKLTAKYPFLSNLLENCVEAPLLGEQQWSWLQQELKHSDAQVHVVVSSIQVLTTNPAMEGWGHFPRERKRLLQVLLRGSKGRQAVPGLVVLSGDVHHAEISDPAAALGDRKGGKEKNTFLEVTSSGLTHHCKEPFYGRLCEPLLNTYKAHRYDNVDLENHHNGEMFFIGRNYGTMEIDWDNQILEVYVHDVDGNEVLWTGERRFGTPESAAKWSHDEIDQIAPCIDGHLLLPTISILLLLLSTPFLLIAFGCWKPSISRKSFSLPRRRQSVRRSMISSLGDATVVDFIDNYRY